MSHEKGGRWHIVKVARNLFIFSSSVRGWDPGHHHSVITPGDGAPDVDSRGERCLPHHVVGDISQRVSMRLAHHSCQHLLSPPALPAFHIKLSRRHCLPRSIHLSIPVWFLFHLILTSQTPTFHYPSPPPPFIHPALLLLAWLIAENEPGSSAAASLARKTRNSVPAPPSTCPTQPRCALITPRLEGIISGRDQIFETWWVRACV